VVWNTKSIRPERSLGKCRLPITWDHGTKNSSKTGKF